MEIELDLPKEFINELLTLTKAKSFDEALIIALKNYIYIIKHDQPIEIKRSFGIKLSKKGKGRKSV